MSNNPRFYNHSFYNSPDGCSYGYGYDPCPCPMTFEEYYQYYLSLHQNRWCRRLHILGQLATIVLLVFIICMGGWYWLLLLLLPFVVYPFAWAGHFLFEHNQPAAFKNPFWAKLCDWRMSWDILRGRIPL